MLFQLTSHLSEEKKFFFEKFAKMRPFNTLTATPILICGSLVQCVSFTGKYLKYLFNALLHVECLSFVDIITVRLVYKKYTRGVKVKKNVLRHVYMEIYTVQTGLCLYAAALSIYE